MREGCAGDHRQPGERPLSAGSCRRRCHAGSVPSAVAAAVIPAVMARADQRDAGWYAIGLREVACSIALAVRQIVIMVSGFDRYLFSDVDGDDAGRVHLALAPSWVVVCDQVASSG